MEHIRVGVIGASAQGSWGSRAHIPALRSIKGFEVAAIATRSAESARASADAFGIPKAFGSVDELVSDPDIDMVSVCVRVPHHAAILDAAVRAGKHIYCEWPLTVTTAEARAASDLARYKGVSTAIGLQGRADPAIVMARRMIADGSIGDVQAVSLTYSSAWPTIVTSDHVLMQDAASGLSQLELSGGHCLDSLCWLLGEFTELSAITATHVPRAKVADTGETVARTSADQISVHGTLAGGATLSAHIMGAPGGGTGTRIEIQGTTGALLLQSASRNVIPSAALNLSHFVKGKAQPVEIAADCIAAPDAPTGEPANVANMYAGFAKALRSGQRFEHDFAAAVQRHHMLDAIRQSSTEGRRILL